MARLARRQRGEKNAVRASAVEIGAPHGAVPVRRERGGCFAQIFLLILYFHII